MSKLAFKEKMTRSAFETKLVADFTQEGLVRNRYVEQNYSDDGKAGVVVQLYYRNEVHIASHSKGYGWIFQSAYEVAYA